MNPNWPGVGVKHVVKRGSCQMNPSNDSTVQVRVRCNRLADPYVWLDGYILDTQCALGLHEGHPDTKRWIDTLRALASKTDMRELTVRALRHGAALGTPGDGAAATLLAEEITNPALHQLLG